MRGTRARQCRRLAKIMTRVPEPNLTYNTWLKLWKAYFKGFTPSMSVDGNKQFFDKLKQKYKQRQQQQIGEA